MVRTDEESLICDFAETYGIYNYRSLPARVAAVLAAGLRENSRIKMKMNNEQISRELFMQAIIADRLGVICYGLSDGTAQKPPSILDMILGEGGQTGKASDVCLFSTPEEFERAWKGGDD
jgi:hypothetical protein